MEIYLRQSLIVPTRVYDLMHERRKFILPQQKFRSIAKTKIAMLNDQKKKLEQKLRKAKGAVSYFFLWKVEVQSSPEIVNPKIVNVCQNLAYKFEIYFFAIWVS